MNNVTVQISILADKVAELNEIFRVELFNVSGRNERLRSGAVSIDRKKGDSIT